MKTDEAKGLIGKYGLFQIGDGVTDSAVKAVSPNGKFVQLEYNGWQAMEKVTFVEELPAPVSRLSETASDVEKMDAAAELVEAQAEIARLKAALAAMTGPAQEGDYDSKVTGAALAPAKPTPPAVENALTFPTQT